MTGEMENKMQQNEAGTPRGVVIFLVVFLVAAVVLAAAGIISRRHAYNALAQRTEVLSAPTVVVKPPKAGSPVTRFTLPGNVTAYTDSPIYARTPGYLTHWYYDIGARVKRGALLAEIATPEVDEQLRQAEADLATAKSNAVIAKIQADRYSELVKTNAVAQQDTDTFVSQATSTAAAVHAAEANLQRLRELQSFEKIYAPFDGVVTARNVDTGQLIDPGAGKELFHMQAVSTLRVYTSVPEAETATLHTGQSYDLTFPERPGKSYTARLVRTADAIDPVSRTLLVELDIENRKGELLPGALADVHFRIERVNLSLIVPVSAMIFRREGMQVATLVGNKAHLHSVVIGEDDGQSVQIISGLNADDRVIQDPPDSLVDGEEVREVVPAAGGR